MCNRVDEKEMGLAALSHRNELVLPKALNGFAVTGFLLDCYWMGFAALSHRNELVLPKALPTPSVWVVVFPCSLLKASFQRSQ
jgi:hypothetical protein